ncbi:MAG: cysteine synthase family protein [Candidatus Thorarchaeota archaeon]|nr:cysteine synthase family protein [Candidatus Thorarchaeota archaeon]
MLYNDVAETVGRTPLVRLNRVSPSVRASILAKLEMKNPGGSSKDRIARLLIDLAEKRGLLRTSMTVIEASSGNTGIGLSMICALKGYDCEIVVPESTSPVRVAIMQSYGARVILTPSELGVDGAREFVRNAVRCSPSKYYNPDQYNNPGCWLVHYESTAKEILEDAGCEITHVVAGLGTSGTLMGIAKRFREYSPNTIIVSVEPEQGSEIPGLRNMDASCVPSIFDSSLVDRREFVSTEAAWRTAALLATREGLLCGPSSGAAAHCALRLAHEISLEENGRAVIVVVLPDSGERYLLTRVDSPTSRPIEVSHGSFGRVRCQEGLE